MGANKLISILFQTPCCQIYAGKIDTEIKIIGKGDIESIKRYHTVARIPKKINLYDKIIEKTRSAMLHHFLSLKDEKTYLKRVDKGRANPHYKWRVIRRRVNLSTKFDVDEG